MKSVLLFLVLAAVVILACADDNKITDEEINELLDDYHALYKNYDTDKNAPVSSKEQIIKFLN